MECARLLGRWFRASMSDTTDVFGAFFVFFCAFSYIGVCFLHDIQELYPPLLVYTVLKWTSLKISYQKASRKKNILVLPCVKLKEGPLNK